MAKLIYADNAATTPLAGKALAAMMPFLTKAYGNASAIHSLGQESKRALEDARRTIANVIGAYVNEIYFTSGGTESDNWALLGVIDAMETAQGGVVGSQGTVARNASPRGHIITSSIEHSAVFHTAEYLETLGHEVSYLPVDKNGQIAPSQLAEAMRSDTILVSIMLANNEMGTLLPIKELRAAVKERNKKTVFHTDAVQAVGHIPLNVRDLGIDILSLSAHKFGGPKGVGAQFIRLGTSISPYLRGGGQEKARRSGTDNVAGVVGMAVALKEAIRSLDETMPQITHLRNRLIEGITQIPGAYLTGHPEERLPGSASFVFEGLSHRPLITRLDEQRICVSSGSSCSSSSEEPSRVLMAAGYPEELSTASLRITLSSENTQEEIDQIISKVEYVVALLREEATSPVTIEFGG